MTTPTELETSAASVLEALLRIESTCGSAVAAQAAELMIRLGGCFMLTRIGPQAAKAAMIATYAALKAEIEAQNCGSAAIS
jgi:hypothetical protein